MLQGGALASPPCVGAWGCGSAQAGQGGTGGGGLGSRATGGGVAHPSLCLNCTGSKAGFHCVAYAMDCAVSIMLRLASVYFRLGARRGRRRGAACCPGGRSAGLLVGGPN